MELLDLAEWMTQLAACQKQWEGVWYWDLTEELVDSDIDLAPCTPRRLALIMAHCDVAKATVD